MNTSGADSGARWWAHLRQRPGVDPGTARGVWPVSDGIGLRATRAPGPFDEVGPEPPIMGVLAFSDEALNRRAESFGVTERSLGWLRAWGERFGDLAFEVVEYVLDHWKAPVAPDAAALLADVDRLLSGRLDDEWLAAERRAAARGDGGEVVTVLRMLGLCQAAAAVGANPAETGALAAAVACCDAFRRSVRTEAVEHAAPGAAERTFALLADEVKIIADPQRAVRSTARPS